MDDYRHAVGLIAVALSVAVAGGGPLDEPEGGPNPRVDPSISVPNGFEVELLHEVDAATQGSWVALCDRPDGTLYAVDQYGGLFRITPPPLDDFESPPVITPVGLPLNGAQGLLYAFDALYVMETGRGLLRITDSDGNGEVDAPELIVEVSGDGEHGSHAVVLHPDGDSLLIVCGNHTPLPASLTDSRVPMVWGEDLLLARDPDPRGHATGRMAPGGYVCRVAADGSEVELIACGFRNSYDVAVSPDGEIFAFDSDMEWDLGLPWYRPARLCHAVSGADFGWRFGSGKWPEHYPDSLPPVVDIGPASPTGMLFGTGGAFPARYQRALFMLDWTYGIIYAVHLRASGATFDAEVERFVVGKPLPVTDAAMGADGALYFATGGRRLGSRLYRVVYRGDESTEPAGPIDATTPEARQRRQLEAMHADPTRGGLDEIWDGLGSRDRFVRHAARVALEHRPVSEWRDRALMETDAGVGGLALIALARHPGETDAGEVFESILRLKPEAGDDDASLAILRATALAMIRLGLPDGPTRARLIEHIGGFSGSRAVEMEAVRVLVALGDPGVIDRGLARLDDTSTRVPVSWAELARQNDQYGAAIRGMLDAPPPTDGILYAQMLSNLESGWTFRQRQALFTFLQRAMAASGGMSYRGFIEAIGRRALQGCTERERAVLEPLLRPVGNPADLPPVVFPAGPRREWTTADAVRATATLRGRSLERGAGLYRIAACMSCHQMNGIGSNIGPDLSSVGRTYARADLVRAIIEPNHAVTDQYAVSIVTTTDDETISGRIVEANEEQVAIAPYFGLATSTTTLPRDRIRSIERSDTSAMPAGLVNSFSPDDLRDLIAYLVSGGDPDDAVYRD
jgi:putative heme-binding domain-containing protein